MCRRKPPAAGTRRAIRHGNSWRVLIVFLQRTRQQRWVYRFAGLGAKGLQLFHLPDEVAGPGAQLLHCVLVCFLRIPDAPADLDQVALETHEFVIEQARPLRDLQMVARDALVLPDVMEELE